MATMKFLLHDGSSRDVPLIDGTSLMQLARDHGVPGIDGDCGGACACGTCHVVVGDAWIKAAGPRTAEEQQMMAMTPDVQPGSRLCCQITASAALDGLEVRVPEYQM